MASFTHIVYQTRRDELLGMAAYDAEGRGRPALGPSDTPTPRTGKPEPHRLETAHHEDYRNGADCRRSASEDVRNRHTTDPHGIRSRPQP